MNPARFEALKAFLPFGDEDVRTLAALAPLFETHADDVAAALAERTSAHPQAARLVSDPLAHRQLVRDWFLELAGGVYDASYLERRARAGRKHVEAHVPPDLVVAAMDIVRRRIMEHLRRELGHDPPLRERSINAVHKILDLDLAVMLEAYHEKSLAQAARAERRATVEELAAHVRHELGERLALVRSSTHLLEKKLGEGRLPPALSRHLATIRQGVDRASATVSAFLELARDHESRHVEVDLNHVARDAVANVAGAGSGTIALELDPRGPRVRGDPELLESVLLALVRNAVDANGDRPGVSVATRVEGGRALVTVLDEGPGLSKEILPRLFEQLFTTKPHGAGLGLVTAKVVVTGHGGRIEGRNRADRGGAEFSVELPLAGVRDSR